MSNVRRLDTTMNTREQKNAIHSMARGGLMQWLKWFSLVFDLPPPSRTTVNSKKSVNQENDGYEEKQIH